MQSQEKSSVFYIFISKWMTNENKHKINEQLLLHLILDLVKLRLGYLTRYSPGDKLYQLTYNKLIYFLQKAVEMLTSSTQTERCANLRTTAGEKSSNHNLQIHKLNVENLSSPHEEN